MTALIGYLQCWGNNDITNVMHYVIILHYVVSGN